MNRLFSITFLFLIFLQHSFAGDDRKEILQDLICELSGVELSIRDGVSKEKKLATLATSVKISRSIENWNISKKDMDIIITPRGTTSSNFNFEYLALLGKFNNTSKTNTRIWYENTDDVYEITEIDDFKKAPTKIENIKIDRINGNLFYRSSIVGSYSSVKILSGKCKNKNEAKLLK